MPFVESLLFALAPAIGKILLKAWLGQGPAVDLSGIVLDQLIKRGGDRHQQQAQARQLATIAQQTATELKPFFDSEAGNLSQDERRDVVRELAQTLEQTRLTTQLLIACQYQPDRVAEQLRAVRPDATRDLTAAQSAIYERLLDQTSAAIVRLAPQLDGFTSGLAIQGLQDDQRILEIVSAILHQPDDAAEQFERDYREVVIGRLDHLEYFGLPDPDKLVVRQPLSDAYVTLRFERRSREREREPAEQLDPLARRLAHDDERASDRQRVILSGPVDLLLAEGQRLVIRGEPGGGKSTLLQWLAVRSAQRTFPAQLAAWNDSVPFFVRLRERVGQDFPAAHELPGLVARDLAAEQPQGWVRRQLKAGRAILLVDGVDELPRQQRDAMLERLRQLVHDYPLARVVISSRPAALKDDEWPEWAAWIDQAGFVDASLQPLDTDQIAHLIERWHHALGKKPRDDQERDKLQQLPDQLLRLLRQRPALRKLATNPLLCAMLCALHYDRGATLPVERVKLYSECVEMLLERRDTKRGIKPDVAYLPLTYLQKLALLKGFALWLMRNGSSEVECSDADAYFARELPNLGLPDNGKAARAFFVDRSGLMREPVEGRVDFTHRTFQEFLGAQAVLDDECIPELIGHAQEDQWRETILLAAGLAPRKACDRLIAGLLARGNQPDQQEHRSQLHLLALACLETAVEVSPPQRQDVVWAAAMLFPPSSTEDAERYAAAGEFAVPLLAAKAEHDQREAAACVQVLALIGSVAALRTLAGYAGHSSWHVKQEIGRAWESFDRTQYAAEVLSQMSEVHLPGFPSLEQLLLLSHVTALTIEQDGDVTDLEPLGQLVNLQQLALSELGQVGDIGALGQLVNLQQLALSELGQVGDIEALGQLANLQQLRLFNLEQVGDIGALGQLANLQQLALSNLEQVGDIGALGQLANLQQLTLSELGQVSDIEALGQLRNLQQLTLSELGQVGDIGALRQLRNLQRLNLSGCAQISDVRPLAQLPNLRYLDLRGTAVQDVSPLRDKPGLVIRR